MGLFALGCLIFNYLRSRGSENCLIVIFSVVVLNMLLADGAARIGFVHRIRIYGGIIGVCEAETGGVTAPERGATHKREQSDDAQDSGEHGRLVFLMLSTC